MSEHIEYTGLLESEVGRIVNCIESAEFKQHLGKYY